MTTRVGINGFGRIGRSFTRAILARGAEAGVELVAVNDPFGDSETAAFLLKHDSVGGTLANDVRHTADGFSIDGRSIKKLESKDPAEIAWADNGVDVVIESTGVFTAREVPPLSVVKITSVFASSFSARNVSSTWPTLQSTSSTQSL